MPVLAAAATRLRQSPIRAVTLAIQARGGINLGQGLCDLPTPEPIRDGAHASLDAGVSTYTAYNGIAPLRAAIAEKARTFNRLPVRSDDEVVVSVGSTGAFAAALLALCEPGDEAIVFEPFYGYHTGLMRLFGIVPVSVPLDGPNWDVDLDAVRAAITSKTKVVVVCTPANPSGKVWTEAELAGLLALAEAHDLWIVTDEIYEYMTYDGRQHVSLASLPGAYDRTVTVSGFSKTYNMTGWRLGYAVARPDVAERIGLVSDLLYVCAPAPLQHGVAAAFAMPGAYFDDLLDFYVARRAQLCDALERVGMAFARPQGAYYVLADTSPLRARFDGFENADAAMQTLIEKAGVGTVSGTAFFADSARAGGIVRFCYAKEEPILDDACRRLIETFGR